MRSPGQEIVGLGERGSRLLRKQAEAERQRGRSAGGGGRKGAPGAGMPAMLPLRAGVRDPPLHPLLHPLLDLLPDPLPAVPKLQFGHGTLISSAWAGVEQSSSPRGAVSSSSTLGLALPQFPQP